MFCPPSKTRGTESRAVVCTGGPAAPKSKMSTTSVGPVAVSPPAKTCVDSKKDGAERRKDGAERAVMRAQSGTAGECESEADRARGEGGRVCVGESARAREATDGWGVHI